MEIDKDTIKRAWESKEYRDSLAPEVRDAIPARPPMEGGTELTDDDLKAAAGGATPVAESEPSAAPADAEPDAEPEQ